MKRTKEAIERGKVKSKLLMNELIHASRPYITDDRLFKAVDDIRVFITNQLEFIDSLANFETEDTSKGEK